MVSILPSLLLKQTKRPTADIGDWLGALHQTTGYRTLYKSLQGRHELRSFLPADELATTALLIRHLQPTQILEIGTRFAGATRVMAEALQGCAQGKITTVDCYGAERVPGILSGWPTDLRGRVEFQSANSMTYFSRQDDQNAPKGAQSPLSLACLHGASNFEGVIFDVVRAAEYLAPGGVIFVSNLDHVGPRQAVIRFLQWNPAWRLFCRGRIVRQSSLGALARTLGNAAWGVLLAPQGVQIAEMAFKSFERGVPYQPIRAIRLNDVETVGSGFLTLKLNYAAFPFDHHITGAGLLNEVRSVNIEFGGAARLAAPFEPAVELPLAGPDYVILREVEAMVLAEEDGSYILLDKNRPITFD